MRENAIALRDGPSQRGTALRKIILDEGPDARPIAEQLRDAISEQAVRVIELFREWDEDGSGNISKAELHKALPLLGLDVPPAAIDELFASWDPDGSGSVELNELNKQLRRGSSVQIDAALQPGAAGEISTSTDNAIALRTGGPSQRGTALRKIDLDEAKPIQEQLRNAITEQAVRVIELFREWDEDGPARNSLWRAQLAAQFSDAAFHAPQVTAPCRRKSSAAPCRCSAWRCRRQRSTSSSTAGPKATARSRCRSSPSC